MSTSAPAVTAAHGVNAVPIFWIDSEDHDWEEVRRCTVLDDDQTPHTRDELYVVVAGSGIFVCAGERRAFAIGDALFAPAGSVHRFEDFSDDLAVWVMFYGPEGGEGKPTL